MASSKRKLILDNIATVLATIATGSGYNFTIGQVQRGLKAYTEVPEDKFPSLFIVGGDEDRRDETNLGFLSDMDVHIVGYVKGADAADAVQLEQYVDNLIEDVTKALYVDHTRGGNAVYTEVQKVEADKGAWTPYCGFVMKVLVHYKGRYTAP